MPRSFETLSVAPSNVCFLQDSISEKFGEHAGGGGFDGETHTIEGTFKDLLYGVTDISSIRPISVVRNGGKMWAVSGNRRLYVYRKLQEYRRISKITVQVKPIDAPRFNQMNTTKNGGQSIYIRQDRKRGHYDKMEQRLKNIYSEWIRHGQPTDGRMPTNETTAYPYDWSGSLPRSSVTSIKTPPESPRPNRSNSDFVWNPTRAYQPTPPSPPPPAEKKSDSWCTIL